ncbi:MAG: MSHA biogenesis protein MshO [Candidatus Azotimanducaceae bacterium]|jgi:MSHA biogenesis protein MshO
MRRRHGFTLIELVVVIVLMSLISLAGVEVIRQSSQSYLKMSDRQALGNAARFVIERMSREFRLALPGSVRVSGACIEYMPIKVAGTYFSAPIESGSTVMTVVRVSADLETETGRIAIYPVGADVYDLSTAILSPDASIGAPDVDNVSTITWSGSHTFSFHSPTRRFYMVDSPVSYCVDGEHLFRYTNYGIAAVQPVVVDLPAALPDRALLVNQVTGALTPFSAAEPGLTRNAIVMLSLAFSAAGESIEVTHEAHLRNVP